MYFFKLSPVSLYCGIILSFIAIFLFFFFIIEWTPNSLMEKAFSTQNAFLRPLNTLLRLIIPRKEASINKGKLESLSRMFLRGREGEERRLPRRCTYAARSRGEARRRPLCEWLTWFNADTAVPGGVIPDRCFGISSIFGSARETAPGRGGRLWSSRPPSPVFAAPSPFALERSRSSCRPRRPPLQLGSSNEIVNRGISSIPLDLRDLCRRKKKTGHVTRS